MRGRQLAIIGLIISALIPAVVATTDSPARVGGVRPLRFTVGDRMPLQAEMDAFLSIADRQGLRSAILQFEKLPDASERERLAARGITLHRYQPDNAFIATIPAGLTIADCAELGIRWVGGLRVEEKLAEALLPKVTPDWCRDADGLARFTISLFPHVQPDSAAAWLSDEYGAGILGVATLSHAVAVTLPGDSWLALAEDERVLRIEPFWPRRVHNNSARTNCGAAVAQAAPYNLDGSGVMVAEWDEGQVDRSHADFDTRVTKGDNSAISAHSTHVAGTVLGSGAASSGTYRGMAPAAELISHQWWNSSADLENDVQNDLASYDIDISQNSWGVGYTPPTQINCNAFLGNYFSECATLDDIARGSLGKPVTIVWSAGNERGTHPDYCGSIGFSWGTIGPFATAKNVIAIGAINSNNSTMTNFSSWGPTDDGRLKPDLVAAGCQSNGDGGLTSTVPGGGYATACGTSMSAPTTTGCIALWLERWKALYPGRDPYASTVKAAFIESAIDLGDPGPEYDFGYGNIDVAAAIDRLDAGLFAESTLVGEQVVSWSFVNDGSLSEISVTLAWDDPGAGAGANPTLVNDLNLRIVAPDGSAPATYLPWVLNPADPSSSATTGVDGLNNVEQVRIAGALPAGVWTVEVTGSDIPIGPQTFSLVHSPGFSLIAGGLSYAVGVSAAADTISAPGALLLNCALSNLGQNNDTYDVTITSARGWALTPASLTRSVDAQSDSSITVLLDIPVGVGTGEKDTVTFSAVSQSDPGAVASDPLVVTTLSGHAVAVLPPADTAAIQGKTVNARFTITNTGLFSDTIDWSARDFRGWTVTPANGSFVLDAGADRIVAVAIRVGDPETIGSINTLSMTARARSDAAANASDFARVTVVDFPPQPLLVDPQDAAILASGTPLFMWDTLPHVAYPPGSDEFTFTLEIADDPVFATGRILYEGLSATSLTVPSVLDEGQHFWRVWTHNLFGDSIPATTTRSFEVDTQAPGTPTLMSPADPAYEADTTPVFAWGGVTAKSASSVSYLFEMSPDSLFTHSIDSVWTDLTSYTIPNEQAIPPCSTIVYWRVTAYDAAGNWSLPATPATYRVYMVGDAQFDCVFNALDLVRVINHVFRSEPPPDPPGRAETNCTAVTDILDVVVLVNYIFRSGPPPCGPE